MGVRVVRRDGAAANDPKLRHISGMRTRSAHPINALLTLLALALAFTRPLAAQDTPESTRAKQDVLWARMADSVRRIAGQTDAVVGVAILDLTDHRGFYLNADATYPTASTIKIAILAELFRQDAAPAQAGPAAPGHAHFTDEYVVDKKDLVGGSGLMGGFTPGTTRLTVRDLATLMIGLSDNSATNIITGRVGMEYVNALLSRLGLKATRLRRLMMDAQGPREGRENTATPRELVTLLDSLHSGHVLGGATDAYFRMLGTQKSSYIPLLLPPNVRTANKPGELDGVRNDAGIVFVPNRPFAIAVMTTYGGNAAEAQATISQVARTAWVYFDRIGRSNPLGRTSP